MHVKKLPKAKKGTIEIKGNSAQGKLGTMTISISQIEKN